jgi:hypothetical protein
LALGSDTFPLAGGIPNGEVWSREAALEAFRTAFLIWVNDLDPGQWESNRDLSKANAERWKKR